jgi:hypothetical protein
MRMTRGTAEVFSDGERICSHFRLYGRSGQYGTQESHMPKAHRQYAKWDGDRFRNVKSEPPYSVNERMFVNDFVLSFSFL